ncbi:MAG: hypothetical protein ACC707_15685, partial [Thiohalomonadales bacterium]
MNTITAKPTNHPTRPTFKKFHFTFVGLLSLFLFSPVNAQIGGTAIGINAISKLVCENKTTGQQIELKNPGATSWDCEKIGLVATPGDIIKQTFKGTVNDPAYIGGSIKGITAITKLKCDNTSAQQVINIKPPTPDWNCASTGLIINMGDIVKQTLIGSMDQVAAIVPIPPTSFTAVGGDGSITVSWTPSLGTDTTRIYSNVGPLIDPTTATLLYDAINSLPPSFTHS